MASSETEVIHVGFSVTDFSVRPPPKEKKKRYMNASSRQFGGLDCSVADVIVVGQ